ncbi:hypothetical protein [Aeromicrobium sp. Root344]|uniref:hypothetical protein n=1 Tax=Aeromicrobium sp. Root344 TaxID=1736521 RepID=UPI0012F8599C|nr:hypothetical protein [Aeromicrobium sp. Root344]
MTPDELWADLRQGARNFAGVTWQAATTAHLLISARAGDLPFARITPEGMEDVDCEHVDGSKTFVQMKEIAGGQGTLAAAGLAEALTHAHVVAGSAYIAVVTDAGLGSGLTFSGWEAVIGDQGDDVVNNLMKALKSRGLDDDAAANLLQRSRLIHLPWQIRAETEKVLGSAFDVHPTVAQFVVGALYDLIDQSAATQRGTSLPDAVRHSVRDVDALVQSVQSAVDLEGLSIAVASGICSAADYIHPADVPARQFYLGMDGSPALVAAGHDVFRPREFGEVVEGLHDRGAALLLGPSGSGKSVMMWRAARDAMPAARVLRVTRLETDSDVRLLVRHAQLLRPSSCSPLLVAADNLGRPSMAKWPQAATYLRELNETYLIGACRAEDFHPSLAKGATQIIDLLIDVQTARAIGERVRLAGIEHEMNPDEAHGRSEGLLMEFLAMLITGQRLNEVLAEQVAELGEPGRELERDAARLLSSVHSLGLAMNSDRLGMVLQAFAPGAVGDALSRLRDEHIVINDGANWRGLHELRSRVLSNLLHESPPPTLAATLARAIDALAPDEAGWLLRRAAEHDSQGLEVLAEAAAAKMSEPSTTAVQAAELLEGAERADNVLYTRRCIPILDANRPAGLSIHHLANFTYGMRNQGLTFEPIGDPSFDQGLREVKKVAAKLPDRSAATAQKVAAKLNDTSVRALGGSAENVAEATRFLEAAHGFAPLSPETVAWILQRFPEPAGPEDVEPWSRLIEQLSASLAAGQVEAILGTPASRATQVAKMDPNAIYVSYETATSTVSLRRLLPPNPTSPLELAWDASMEGSSADIINDSAVAAARNLAAACPEAEIVEVITLDASQRRVEIAGHEPGYKRMARDAFPDRVGVRRNVGFQAALRRSTAAQSWTSLVRAQITTAEMLTELAGSAVARLSPRDNANRRANWQSKLDALAVECANQLARPAATGVGLGVTHAGADAFDRKEDDTTRALLKATDALRGVLGPRLLVAAMSIRDAVVELGDARAESSPHFGALGAPISDELIENLAHIAALLATIHFDPSAASHIRAGDLLGSSNQIVSAVSQVKQGRQAQIIASITGEVPGAHVHRFEDPRSHSWALDNAGWLVITDAEHWPVLKAAMEAASKGEREDLGCRVVGAATTTEAGETYILPIAAVMSAESEPGSHDLLPEDIEEVAAAAGIATRLAGATTTRISRIVQSLVELSHDASRRRSRPPTWPPLIADSLPTLADIEAEGRATLSAFPPQVTSAFDLLLRQVAAEIEGSHDVVLASLFLQGLENDLSAARLVDAVNVLMLSSLS